MEEEPHQNRPAVVTLLDQQQPAAAAGLEKNGIGGAREPEAAEPDKLACPNRLLSEYRQRTHASGGCSALWYLVVILVLCFVFVTLLYLSYPCIIHSEPQSIQKKTCLTAECVKTAAALLGAMDRTADPCHDFFQFACGTWNKKHVIPEDRSSISTFEVMADKLQIVLKVNKVYNLSNLGPMSLVKSVRVQLGRS